VGPHHPTDDLPVEAAHDDGLTRGHRDVAINLRAEATPAPAPQPSAEPQQQQQPQRNDNDNKKDDKK
jgi:hypothetical protein